MKVCTAPASLAFGLTIALASLMSASAAVSAENSDWSRFRGPNGSGIAEEAANANLPVELTADKASWSRDVLFGHSSPIVAGGKVFLTGIDGDRLITAAYDAAIGTEHWRRSVPRHREDKLYAASSPVVATPVSDGENVYSFFPEFGVVSYDSDGNERWRLEMPPFASFYGLAGSPILEGGVLILLCDQTREPFILGLDPSSGEQLWKKARDIQAESWTTPVVHQPGTEQASIITFGTFVADAFDPRTGNGKWRMLQLGAAPVSSPIVAGDMVYVVAPDQQEESTPPSLESFAALDMDADLQLTEEEMANSDWLSSFRWLDIDGNGKAALSEIKTQLDIMASPDFGLVAIDISEPDNPKIAWRQKKTLPYIASPIVYRDVLFLIKDGGILTSYDPMTGEVLKRARIKGAVEPFSPSPIAVDGKLYLASNTGTVAVVSAEAQWETLAVSDLDEEIFATPAVADGRLFIRTRSKLYAFAGDSAKP